MLRLHATSLVLAFGLGFAMHGLASAQSLPELYEAARGYDAVYLAARAQAESAKFRAAQAESRWLPRVDLTAGASQTETSRPTLASGNERGGTTTVEGAVQAKQPLYNPCTTPGTRC